MQGEYFRLHPVEGSRIREFGPSRAPGIAGKELADTRACRTTTPENHMKIKSNIRAGAGSQKQNSKSQINNTIVTYIPAISRCVGI